VTIRFLQPASSESPDFPFQTGQVITVACPTPSMLDAIAKGFAEVMKVDETERAVMPASETPESDAPKPRTRRVKPAIH
jgi:hypothetical protein